MVSAGASDLRKQLGSLGTDEFTSDPALTSLFCQRDGDRGELLQGGLEVVRGLLGRMSGSDRSLLSSRLLLFTQKGAPPS